MADLPPPPPYTPRDPNSPVSSAAAEQSSSEQNHVLSLPSPFAGTRPPTYYSAYGPNSPGAAIPVADGFSVTNASSVILTPPASPQNHNVESLSYDLSLSSSRAYFESRPSLVRRPNHICTNHITITPDTTPSDIPFPSLTAWRARDVDDQDWATFLNHLFPRHHASANAQITDRKVRAEIDHNLKTDSANVEKLQSAQLDGLLGSSVNDENQVESEAERSERIEAVIAEWNDGFFLPRGLKIVGAVQPFSSSSLKDSPPSGENIGCSHGRRREGTRDFMHHNGFPHHGRHGHHGHYERREQHDSSHSHWKSCLNGGHGARRENLGRSQGYKQDASSIQNAPMTKSASIPRKPVGCPGSPLALGASSVPPYIGLGEAVRHTANQFGDVARFTALQLSEAARLAGQQVEEAARSTASQVGEAARHSGAQLGQQIEEAARQSTVQLGHFSGAQTRGTPTWNRANTFGPPSPSPSSHRRQSTSSSSRSFPSSSSSLPPNSNSFHPRRDTGAAADVTELANAMEALAIPLASERSETVRTWNREAKRQYKERARERKVEIRVMKQELKQKKAEAKEERKRVKETKKAIKGAKRFERKSRKAERRNLKLKEKMEKAEIKLLGKGAINVLAKEDDSLTPEEKEWWKSKRFEEQEVGVLREG